MSVVSIVFGEVVEIVDRAGEARGPMAEVDSGNDSSDPEDAIKAKDKT